MQPSDIVFDSANQVMHDTTYILIDEYQCLICSVIEDIEAMQRRREACLLETKSKPKLASVSLELAGPSKT